MPYISLQYHRQVPAPGPSFQWQGMGPARTWRSAATVTDLIRKLYATQYASNHINTVHFSCTNKIEVQMKWTFIVT